MAEPVHPWAYNKQAFLFTRKSVAPHLPSLFRVAKREPSLRSWKRQAEKWEGLGKVWVPSFTVTRGMAIVTMVALGCGEEDMA